MDPYKFIQENIDSVPQLEALILLWNSRPVGWTTEEMSSRLYVQPEQLNEILRDLIRMQMAREVHSDPPRFAYFSQSEEQNNLMHEVDAAYRRELVRISTMIHSKASSPVREFAKAFRFRKERDS